MLILMKSATNPDAVEVVCRAVRELGLVPHAIPGATRVEILPATGHLLMEEQPDHVATLIREFLTTTTRSGPKGTP